MSVPVVRQTASLGQHLDQLRRNAGWNVPTSTLCLGLFGAAMLAFVVVYTLSGRLLPAFCGASRR